ELFGLGLLYARGILAQRDANVLHAAVAQIQRMRVALAAIADDGDLLALDQVKVGVAVVVNAHGLGPSHGRRFKAALFLEKLVAWVVSEPGQAPSAMLLWRLDAGD